MTHRCPECNADVPDERRELLGVDTCAKCTPQRAKPRGVMAYSHKTAGVLDICETDSEFWAMKGIAEPEYVDDLEDVEEENFTDEMNNEDEADRAKRSL
jgi:hypothetical protein